MLINVGADTGYGYALSVSATKELCIPNYIKQVAESDIDEIISGIEKRLVDINVKIKLTDQAKDYFIDNGYDEFYGARPLKRLVSNKLETLIAKKILEQEILPNTKICIDCLNDELILRK